MKSATKKPRNFKAEVKKAQEHLLVACCSSAIDLIFTDASVTAEVGGQAVKGSSIRLKQTGKTCISILGLDPRTVNKEAPIWQIFVVSGTCPPATDPCQPPPSPKPPKKKASTPKASKNS
jgi:hypothetical protein